MFDMCYTDIMIETYRHSPTTVSLCNYHFVFCSWYRRKIFLLPGVEAFFKERIEEECRLRSIRILAMPSTWTRSYFVSTAGNVSSETIKHYADSQKTRS